MTMTLEELMADYRAAPLPESPKAREKRVWLLEFVQKEMPEGLDNLRKAKDPQAWGKGFLRCIHLLMLIEPSRTRRQPKYVNLRKEWEAIVLQAVYGEAGPHARNVAVSLGAMPVNETTWVMLHSNMTAVSMLYHALHGQVVDAPPVRPEDLDGLGL
jgi:hypothetical protein